ncbi:class III signal peptide-containing protein [Candidatus Micrarchaeota archaeon]|nr:class III signal peptide-containing protein [Candidatus Micrarchaeota archaeon]
MSKNVKGQVSTEYLVILAVVLVVALVVVYLVGGFSGLGASSLETQSKNYWAGASPFAIKTVKATGTTLTLQMANNDLEQLTLTDVSVAGASVFSTSTTYNSGEEKSVDATLGTACGNAGAPYQYANVTITYTKGTITGLKQVGVKPLVGKCS